MAEGAERFRGLWEDEMFARQEEWQESVAAPGNLGSTLTPKDGRGISQMRRTSTCTGKKLNPQKLNR